MSYKSSLSVIILYSSISVIICCLSDGMLLPNSSNAFPVYGMLNPSSCIQVATLLCMRCLKAVLKVL